jgi:AAA ATPase domain
MTHLGDLLDDARRRTFVGRRHELASLDDALVGRSPRRVLFVHGPGGIGKTTLLLEFRVRARAAGRTVVLLDGREDDPSPEGFERAVLVAVGERRDSGLLAEFLAGAVLLVDGYEQLGPIDRWLRQAFLPALPADAVVVLAGRDAPRRPGAPIPVGARWSQSTASTTSMRRRAASCLLVPALPRPSVRGHPLAMALLADVAVTARCLTASPRCRILSRRCWSRWFEGPDGRACDRAGGLCHSLANDRGSASGGGGRRRTGGLGVAGMTAVRGGWATWALAARYCQGCAGRRVRAPVAGAVSVAAPRRSRPCGCWPACRRRARPATARPAPPALAPQEPAHRRVLYAVGAGLGRGGPRAPRGARPGPLDPRGVRGCGGRPPGRGWLAEQPDSLSVVRDGEGVLAFAYHVWHPTGSAMEDRDPVTGGAGACRGPRAGAPRRAGRHRALRRWPAREPA